MFDTVSADSAQDYLTLTLTNAVDTDSEVVLSDADGNELFCFTAPKAASMLLLSSADISSDADYTLTSTALKLNTARTSCRADRGRRPQR